MDPFAVAFYAVYAVSFTSVAAIFYAVGRHARRSKTPLGVNRLLQLTKDEAKRLESGDPVYLMHLSIALGVALSIAFVILDPVWSYSIFPWIRLVFLAISIPLILGLIAAFAWRIQRYKQSKAVERDLLHTGESFSRASTKLQLILILAIAFTLTELILVWFPALAIYDAGLNVVRNALVVVYYSKPTVNLMRSFDKPLPDSLRLPFKLSDVMEGKVDPSNVKIGVSQVSEFEDYERLSFDSCVEIGACESACPATAAGRPLSPRILVRKVSLLASDQNRESGRNKLASESAPLDPMSTVGEDELWSCTTCGACVHACPVSVKHLDIIYDLRRNLVNNGKLDKDKSTLLQNLTQNQNPYGFNSSSRADWARDQGIDTLATNPNAEYLYWVGCVSSFDQRAQKIAQSLSKILKHAGISFAILGSEELCNGDPARRLGEEGRYQELAYQNIEKMNSYGVKKVITTCPHCFNVIKNEYGQFGGNYQVIYHTQLISDLITGGKIKLAKEKVKEISVTMHDACYAARYNNVFDEPRKVLDSTGSKVHEMHRIKDRTFCCGAGGSNYWFKVPQQRTIAGIRTEEAAATGASTIATECPFCLSMFEDSTKVSDTKLGVKDIAELVAEEL